MILVGTDDGFAAVGADLARRPAGHRMDALAVAGDTLWAISDGSLLWRHRLDGDGEVVAKLTAARANCVVASDGGVLVGASAGRLFALEGEDLVLDRSFAEAPGRDTWHTPWGGPPDVRSMSVGVDDVVYVNVHVGGVLRRGGAGWEPTMDIAADVHQVLTHPRAAGTAYAASAIGLGVTSDGAASWSFHADGLHGAYCRAVAVGDDYLLVSASLGSGGRQAAVYRRPLDLSAPFHRCTSGLPEWFPDNVDTFCVAAEGATAVIGAGDGTVYVSEDGGVAWEVAATGLPGVHCLAVVTEAVGEG